MRSLNRLGTAVALLAALSVPAAAAPATCEPDSDTLLVLDASFSMLRTTPAGATRFNIARQAIGATVDLVPAERLVALRLYGSESAGGLMDCRDTVLKVPFAPAAGNRALIKLALASAHARGVTPIGYVLEQAALDFPAGPAGHTIILVSDGGETCGGEPCTVAQVLAAEGFVIHTIGFFVDVQGRRTLQCIAGVTGGEYFPVPVAAQLQDVLTRALGICPIAFLGPPFLRPHGVEETGRFG